jgi:hypothetical protein
MASLHAKGKKAGKSTQTGGKLKLKPMAILDLDNSDDEDDDGDEGGIMEKERKSIEKLQKILGSFMVVIFEPFSVHFWFHFKSHF